MDPNVNALNQLLEKGYVITSHTLSVVNKKECQVIEHIVELRLKEKKHVIKSSNSKEFDQYINHFVKCIDKFDNAEFVFIKDLESFNQIRGNTLPNAPPLLKDRHQIKISGRLFSKGILSSLQEIKQNSSIKTVGIFWVDLELNDTFRDVDFKDRVEILDDKNQPIFIGFVKKYQYSEKTGFLELQDFSLILENQKFTGEFLNMTPLDSLGLITQSSGMEFNPPSGVGYTQTPRQFVIILPIINLIIDTNFKIGSVEFYQVFDSLDDSIIRKSETGRKNTFWNGNFPRAKTIVVAKDFFEALIKGYTTISKIIDVIAFRTDISFPTLSIQNCQYNFQFSYYKFLSKVKIPTIIYCREMNSRATTFFDIQTIKESILSLNVDSQKYFEEVNVLCNDLALKEKVTQEEENLLLTLHWLRKAIQDGDNTDKFLDLWIAFEFLISGERTTDLFSKDDKEKILEILLKENFSEQQQKALSSKINMINDSPLMEKFNQLTKKMGVYFSDEELVMLKKMRQKRTNIIHGKGDISLTDDELNKMRTILEKIFIGKVNFSKCPQI